MRYLTLACDYDGTIAHHGTVDAPTVAGLERFVASGRKLVLVTGRILDDLERVCPYLHLFERIVVENGAVLYHPATGHEKLLGEGPPPEFASTLEQRGVSPVGVGRVIVATWEPHESTVLSVIKELGLELQVIFNKGAVMVLPAGVNKASGLDAALKEMGLSPHNAVGVGDAENDHAFLKRCECSAAVANALPMVKQTADFTTRGHHGAGVVELIDVILDDDLARLDRSLVRHHVLLGTDPAGREICLPPFRGNYLFTGPPGSARLAVATGVLERLCDAGYQLCIVDQDGHYPALGNAMIVGTLEQRPTIDDVIQHLESPDQNVVIGLGGMRREERPAFFNALLPRVQQLRRKTGRPHWIVVDEAHQLMPSLWHQPLVSLPDLDRMILTTTHPDRVSLGMLQSVHHVIASGQRPEVLIEAFCGAVDERPPARGRSPLEPGEVLLWQRGAIHPQRISVLPGVPALRVAEH